VATKSIQQKDTARAIQLARIFWSSYAKSCRDGVPNNQTHRPKIYYASLVHDVLCQFLDVRLPIQRVGADRAFRDIMARDAFAPRYIYWMTVRLFGGGVPHVHAVEAEVHRGRRVTLPTPVDEPALQDAA